MANRVVLLTGGTGLIGSKLTDTLTRNGYQVNILTRNPDKNTPDNVNHFHWDIKQQTIDANCFENVSYAIHLAGATIAKRWTKEYRKTIIDSRVETANFLLQEMKKNKVKLECYVGASASGYYVPNTGNVLYEVSPSGYGFLAKVCEQWEAAHNQFQQVAKRVVINRIGLVLAKNGGALEKMLPPFQLNIAPHFGGGNQSYPCIHIADVANQFVYSLINNELKGPYNASTEIVSQKQLNQYIAESLGKNVLTVGIPKWVLKLMMGRMRFILTDSLKMSGKKIQNEGFSAQFPTVKEALDDILIEEKEKENNQTNASTKAD